MPYHLATVPYEIRNAGAFLIRLERALISLGKAELTQIRDEGKPFPVECQFCDTVYEFSPEDVANLLKKI